MERLLEAGVEGSIEAQSVAEILTAAATDAPPSSTWLTGPRLAEIAGVVQENGVSTALDFVRENVNARRGVTIGDPLSLETALELGAAGGTEERQLAFDTIAQHPDVARVLEATGEIAEQMAIIQDIGSSHPDAVTYDALVADLKARARTVQARLDDPEVRAGIERVRSQLAELPEDHPMRGDLERIEQMFATYEDMSGSESAVRSVIEPILEPSFRGEDFLGWAQTDGPVVAGQIAGAVVGTILATAAAPVSGGTSYGVLAALLLGSAGGAVGGMVGAEITRELLHNNPNLGNGVRSRLMMAATGEMEWGDALQSYGTEFGHSFMFQLAGMGGAMAIGGAVQTQMKNILARRYAGNPQLASETLVRLSGLMRNANRSPTDFRAFMTAISAEFPQEAGTEILAAGVVQMLGGAEAGWEGAAAGALIGGFSRIFTPSGWESARIETMSRGLAILGSGMNVEEAQRQINAMGLETVQVFRGPNGELRGVLTESAMGEPVLFANDAEVAREAEAILRNSTAGRATVETLARGRIARSLLDLVDNVRAESDVEFDALQTMVRDGYAAAAGRWNTLQPDDGTGVLLDPTDYPGSTATTVDELLTQLRTAGIRVTEETRDGRTGSAGVVDGTAEVRVDGDAVPVALAETAAEEVAHANRRVFEYREDDPEYNLYEETWGSLAGMAATDPELFRSFVQNTLVTLVQTTANRYAGSADPNISDFFDGIDTSMVERVARNLHAELTGPPPSGTPESAGGANAAEIDALYNGVEERIAAGGVQYPQLLRWLPQRLSRLPNERYEAFRAAAASDPDAAVAAI
ncbi:MAG: hypothetical protein AAFY60_04205, partial [Myxococcota bacterium]